MKEKEDVASTQEEIPESETEANRTSYPRKTASSRGVHHRTENKSRTEPYRVVP